MAVVADPPTTTTTTVDADGFNFADADAFQGMTDNKNDATADISSDFNADVFGDGVYDFDIWGGASQVSLSKAKNSNHSATAEKPTSSRKGRSTTRGRKAAGGNEHDNSFDLSFHFEEFGGGGNSFTTATETTASTGQSSVSVQSAKTSTTKTSAASNESCAKTLSAVDPVKKKFASSDPSQRRRSRSRSRARRTGRVHRNTINDSSTSAAAATTNQEEAPPAATTTPPEVTPFAEFPSAPADAATTSKTNESNEQASQAKKGPALSRGLSRRNMMKHMRSNSMVLRKQGSAAASRPGAAQSTEGVEGGGAGDDGREAPRRTASGGRMPARSRAAPETRAVGRSASLKSSAHRRVGGRRADAAGASGGAPKQLGVLDAMGQDAQRRHRPHARQRHGANGGLTSLSDHAPSRQPVRGIGRSRSSDNDDFLGAPSRGVSRSRSGDNDTLLGAPPRGVPRSRSGDNDKLLGAPLRGVPRSRSGDNDKILSRPPIRGVRRSKSSDDDNLLGRPSARGVARSKSNESTDESSTRRPRARRPSLKILERLENDINDEIAEPKKEMDAKRESEVPDNGTAVDGAKISRPHPRRGQLTRSNSMKVRRGANNNAVVAAAANAAAGVAKPAPARGRGLVRSNSMKMLRGGAAKANKRALAGLANNDKPNSLSPPRRGLVRSNSMGKLRDEPEQSNEQPTTSAAQSRPASRRARLARSNSMKFKPGHKQPPPQKAEPQKEEQPVALNPVQRRMMRRNSMKNLFPLDTPTMPQIHGSELTQPKQPLSLKMPDNKSDIATEKEPADATEKEPTTALRENQLEDTQNTDKKPTEALPAESD